MPTIFPLKIGERFFLSTELRDFNIHFCDFENGDNVTMTLPSFNLGQMIYPCEFGQNSKSVQMLKKYSKLKPSCDLKNLVNFTKNLLSVINVPKIYPYKFGENPLAGSGHRWF